MSKQELIRLHREKCRHGHSYLSHFACYKQEEKIKERIGFFDIESSNLDANFGIILSYCIKDSLSNKIFYDVITKKDIADYPPDKTDTRIVRNCIRDIEKFDRLVAHYGKRFDFPFIRTRALYLGIDFPEYGDVFVDDTWVMAKNKLKLNSNRLESVSRILTGHTQKTHLDYKYWIGGIRGDKRSLAYILDHNKKDVVDLEKIYNKLKPFQREAKSSI